MRVATGGGGGHFIFSVLQEVSIDRRVDGNNER